MLLAARSSDLRVAYVSANSTAILGVAPALILERSLTDILGTEAVAAIELALGPERGRDVYLPRDIRTFTFPVSGDRRFDVTAHRSHGLLCVELEIALEPRRWDLLASHLETAMRSLGAKTLKELYDAIPPLVRALRDTPNPRILDVACGTGKLIHHLQRTMPKAQLFGVDLSPHYIQKAQATCAELPGVSLIVGNAEELPLADATFEAVTCGFVFHELPADARRRVVREVARVLKPGGLFVWQDAAQAGDQNADELKYYLDWFPRVYHEPYFKGHMKDPVEGICREAGLEVVSSEPKLFSKLVVARKG